MDFFKMKALIQIPKFHSREAVLSDVCVSSKSAETLKESFHEDTCAGDKSKNVHVDEITVIAVTGRWDGN